MANTTPTSPADVLLPSKPDILYWIELNGFSVEAATLGEAYVKARRMIDEDPRDRVEIVKIELS